MLKEYKTFDEELERYNPRLGERDRDNKAHTHFTSNKKASEKSKEMKERDSEDDKKYYWEFLFWIPYYQEPEGLLVCL